MARVSDRTRAGLHTSQKQAIYACLPLQQPAPFPYPQHTQHRWMIGRHPVHLTGACFDAVPSTFIPSRKDTLSSSFFRQKRY